MAVQTSGVRPTWADAVAALGLAGMLGFSLWAWDRVPKDMPVHWNLAGEPDRFGGRLEGLLLTPAIALVSWIALKAIPATSTRDGFRAALAGFLAVVHAAVVGAAFGLVDPTRYVFVALGLLFMVLGNGMPSLKPNWFAGIRTPWTLSSERAWTDTHRVGGWLFLAVGAATALLGWPAPYAAGIVLLGGLGVGVPLVVAYSYQVWKQDPNRRAV